MQLTFGAVSPGKTKGWSRVIDALHQAIALITPKELAFRLDIKPSYLSDAMNGVDRKAIKIEWIPVILEMAPDSARAAILAELAAPCGYEVIRRQVLTLEEKHEILVKRVAERFGKSGAELLEELER